MKDVIGNMSDDKIDELEFMLNQSDAISKMMSYNVDLSKKYKTYFYNEGVPNKVKAKSTFTKNRKKRKKKSKKTHQK